MAASASAMLILETVIASEAKQSISPRKERMDCFVAVAPRNDVGTERPFKEPE